MSMMQLGLESKRGALQRLGIENPDEKLQELVAELIQDAKEQGVLDLLRAQIADVIALTTFSGAAGMGGGDAGQTAGSPGGNVTSAGGPDVNTAAGTRASTSDTSAPLPGLQPQNGELLQELSDLAAGTKLPQRRTPDSDDES
jgi:hypothetical protein